MYTVKSKCGMVLTITDESDVSKLIVESEIGETVFNLSVVMDEFHGCGYVSGVIDNKKGEEIKNV